jgi:hypothetical protein
MEWEKRLHETANARRAMPRHTNVQTTPRPTPRRESGARLGVLGDADADRAWPLGPRN